jgi:hypothetical protein
MANDRPGTRPSAIEVAQQALAENAVLRDAFAELVARVEVFERKEPGASGEDGHKPTSPAPPDWLSLRAAAQQHKCFHTGE